MTNGWRSWRRSILRRSAITTIELTDEGNVDAHHKRRIMGREVLVAITDGNLHLGQWEHIFYYEFDGRRKKRMLVKIVGE
jgi:thiamine phosphate synthase YjbQ (UPF0047 family)